MLHVQSLVEQKIRCSLQNQLEPGSDKDQGLDVSGSQFITERSTDIIMLLFFMLIRANVS